MNTTKTTEVQNFIAFASAPSFAFYGKGHLIPAQPIEWVLPEGITTSQYRDEIGHAVGNREVISW